MALDHVQPLIHEKAAPPRNVAETGIAMNILLRLMIKAIYVRGLDTPTTISQEMRINLAVTNELLEEARDRGLVEILGAEGLRLTSEFRYGLTEKGRDWSTEALDQSQYVGPTPVSLNDYYAQVARQRLMGERIDRETLVDGMGDLVIPDALVRQLGPAVNSGRSLLLYGPPGNGKTTVAEVIGGTFTDIIHIPYCLEVDGQIIKIYDPTIHIAYDGDNGEEDSSKLRTEDVDRRWIAVRRPTVITGGELNLDMLDLRFNPYSRFYEAPLHLKAIGGTFIIDDLGRQLVRPEDLLNRWITPMETRVDYLTLNTGRTFSIPFDVLLTFSTNLLPDDIMDPAFLRRIPYKIEIKQPSVEDFKKVFQKLCGANDLPYDEGMIHFVIDEVQQRYGQPLSFYQPKFIVDQAVNACKYEGRSLEMEPQMVEDALRNLSTRHVETDAGYSSGGGAS